MEQTYHPRKQVGFILMVIGLVLLSDQLLKVWVKTHMYYQQEFSILGLPWAKIFFVENPGMAFGYILKGPYGKLALSLFRLLAIGFLIYYLRQLVRLQAKRGVLLSFGLILAGAIGNMIDSAFYGLIFSASPMHGGSVAQLFPPEGGYASFLHGKVVDMFYFPIWDGIYPSWLPILGGQPFQFFKPVFNIADVSISVGVLNIILFQRHFLQHNPEPESTATPADLPTAQAAENDGPAPEGTADAPDPVA